MFRYVPFEEIEKNKWNGTVHYSLNSNVQGYYWYLKAVVSEWGAIVENDYETVLPVLLNPLKPYQYALLKELGPYSVNVLNKQRMEEVLVLLNKHNKSGNYPINSRVSSGFLTDIIQSQRLKSVFPGGMKYEELSINYGDGFTDNLYGKGYESIKIMSGKKPEDIVNLLKGKSDYKNALMRIMYNAMHRGVGFSNGIEDKETGKVLAISFFIGSPFCVSELVSYTNGEKKYRQLIFDLILRSNSAKPSRIETFENINDLHELGFDSEQVGDLHLSKKSFHSIKKAFGQAY